ncbi:MAG TPA: hypothetical protein IAB86_05410 [Candidatus Aphodovivens avicola]|nr:hypothetical protein [Candidatus Aphodovivens avicola]
MTGLMREMTGLERLRNVANAMRGYTVHGGGPLDLELMGIADRIEREHLREVDDISGRDADAIAWVESHGGVKECDRKVEASMEVGDKYTLLRMELGKMLGYDLMGQFDASDEELVEKVGKRLMPEGMEWPCYEDGEPVRIGDEFECWCGETHTVGSVTIREGRSTLNESQPHSFVVSDGPFTAHGKRVKRPAPKVYDADGVEIRVGDTVYAPQYCDVRCTVMEIDFETYGYLVEVENEGGKKFRETPDVFTHQRPVLDADGVPIREGDTVYSIETGEPVTVNCVDGDNPWFGTTAGTIRHCSKFTHRAPVFAADGKPLRVGETVFTVNLGIEGVVERIERQEYDTIVHVRFIGDNDCAMREPSDITHERDSWERLEDDADALLKAESNGKGSYNAANDYCNAHGLGTDGTVWVLMARDLVRRAKKLAERGA